MIERRLVSIQLINTRFSAVDDSAVAVLRSAFAADGVSGYVLLHPRKSPMDRYRPAAGAEIVLAAQALGIESVPALIGEWPDDVSSLIPPALITNYRKPEPAKTEKPDPVDLEDMSPMQRARFFADAVKKDRSQSKAGRRLGLSRSYVNNTLQLLKLHPDIQGEVERGELCESAARTIALAPEHAHQLALLKHYKSELERHRKQGGRKPSIRDLEQAIRSIGAGEGDFLAGASLTARYAEELTEHFGFEVAFKSTGKGGWCVLTGPRENDELTAALIRSTSKRHKASVRSTDAGQVMRFYYADPDDLDSVLEAMSDYRLVT